MTAEELVLQIRKGVIDCNDQQLFFSAVIKGLMLNLTKDMKIRGREVPHVIFNTGDDTMWLMLKEYDYSKEPFENTNEQYVYNITPRCTVNVGSLDIISDQFTNPYARGHFQMEYDNQLITLSAETRRIPVKLNVELKYMLDSFTDMLTIIQHIITKLVYIRTYKITYMGQTIPVSYKVPDSFDGEHLAEMSGDTQDAKDRIINLNLEVETSIPVFANETTVDTSLIVMSSTNNLSIEDNAVDTRDTKTRQSNRGS